MRSGGVQATFTQQADARGRVDIAIVRPGDATGVAGTGLLAALLFDAVGAGPANLTVTGTGSAPGGAPIVAAVRAGDGGDGEIAMMHARCRDPAQDGYSFIELLVVTSILFVLASAVMPLAQVTSQRQREAELRRDAARDAHGDRQVQGRGRSGADSDDRARAGQRGLSAGSRDAGRGRDAGQRRLRPEAEVPAARPDRSDDQHARSGACARTRTSRTRPRWGGQNVFDVYTKSEGTALDGTKYRDW